MDKKEVLEQILKLMKEHKISAQEVVDQFLSDSIEFDLLCVVRGSLVRMSFREGKDMNPIGIFPFSDSPKYLELTEISDTWRHLADEKRLPEEEFCEKLYQIRKRLNNALALLNKPLLQGMYFEIGPYLNDFNWLVSFDDNWSGHVASDYFSYDNDKAKIRYVGTYN